MFKYSDETLRNIEHLIHEKTQREEKSIDLTIKNIYNIQSRGSLDFGGSEFKPSSMKPLTPKHENGDDYGWWSLDQGFYLIEYNEKFTGKYALVSPLERLIKTGSKIPTRIITGRDEMIDLLRVPDSGVDIKENARVAALYQIE